MTLVETLVRDIEKRAVEKLAALANPTSGPPNKATVKPPKMQPIMAPPNNSAVSIASTQKGLGLMPLAPIQDGTILNSGAPVPPVVPGV